MSDTKDPIAMLKALLRNQNGILVTDIVDDLRDIIAALKSQQTDSIPRAEVEALRNELRSHASIGLHIEDNKYKGLISERDLLDAFNNLLSRHPPTPQPEAKDAPEGEGER